jgi:hypothetical protein
MRADEEGMDVPSDSFKKATAAETTSGAGASEDLPRIIHEA